MILHLLDKDGESQPNGIAQQLLNRALNGILTFGRQGLFAHDNTHHAFAMAYSAADCLDASGRFDGTKWAAYRKEFESHVVED